MSEQTNSSDRKDAHIALALEPLAMAAIDAGFDNVRLDHCAIPECRLEDIDLGIELLDHNISAPLFIGAMTGGTARANSINRALAGLLRLPGLALLLAHNARVLRLAVRRLICAPLRRQFP